MLTIHFIVIQTGGSWNKITHLNIYIATEHKQANRKQKRIPPRSVYAKMYADGVENKHDAATSEFEDIAKALILSASWQTQNLIFWAK